MKTIEITCKSGRKYSLEAMSSDEVIVYSDTTGDMFLVVELGRNSGSMHGMEVFDAVTRELEIVCMLLKDMIHGVNERAEAMFLIPDSMDYDGKGVELVVQFGYMTGGRRMNLHDMGVSIKPVRICVDLDCNVTICCDMEYKRGEESDSRNLRLGSGKGFDEALFNARKRIGGMYADIQEIEESLYERLCVSGEWEEK